MEFKLNTKPLKDALDLTVVNINISKFFEKSTVIELSVEGNKLRLNTQATSLLSEAYINGYCDEQGTASAIVDNTLFKNLISTLESNEVSLEFTDNALVVKSGKSKFNVPLLFISEDDALSLDRPQAVTEQLQYFGELDTDAWKLIRDNQLYALSISQIYKVYTRVWMGKEQGTITGDPTMSFFTYNSNNPLNSTCMLSSTVVNLLSSLENGSKIYKIDEDNYSVFMDVDSFTFNTQFTVEHEGQDDIGDYNSEVVLSKVLDDSVTKVPVSKSKIYKYAKQASLFKSDAVIYIRSNGNEVRLVNDDVDCVLSTETTGMEYNIGFVVSDLAVVVSHMVSEDLSMNPLVDPESQEVYGVRFTGDELYTILGGVE